MAKTAQADQSIKKLQQRFADLNDQRIRTETQLEAAQKKLADLTSKAETMFGTSDVSELKSKLVELKKKNDKMRSSYQKSLDEIEQKLIEIKEKFAEADIAEE